MRLLADDSKNGTPKLLARSRPIKVDTSRLSMTSHCSNVGEKHSTRARAGDKLHSCPAESSSKHAAESSSKQAAESSSKQAAAGDTRLAANNHNGHSVGILHTQNLVSEL